MRGLARCHLKSAPGRLAPKAALGTTAHCQSSCPLPVVRAGSGEAGLPSQDLGEGGHLHPLARGDSRGEAGGSRHAPSRHPRPAFQAHLSVGQADDPLTPIQVLAAVACRKKGEVRSHLPGPAAPETIALCPAGAGEGTHGRRR